MKMMNVKVGEKVYGAEMLQKGIPGARLEMSENGLFIYFGLPNISASDIMQFENGKFEFSYCGQSNSGLTAILLKNGRDVAELAFNVNLYPDNRFEEFKTAEGTFIYVQLYDCNTYEVKAIRVLPLNEKLKAQFVTLWQATNDNCISQTDYDQWLDNFVFSRSVDFNYKNSRQLGYIKYGYATQELTFVE